MIPIPVCFFISNPGRRDHERDHGPYGYCNNFSCLALTSAAGVGPGARRAIRRRSTRSSPVTNSAVPTGRPVLSARRRAAKASSRFSRSKSGKQDTRSSTGRTITNPSSFPARWARTLDHAQSAGCPTKPARTGFFGLAGLFSQQISINLLVAVLKKDRLSAISLLRNVMRKAGNHQTRPSCHGEN